MSKKKKDHLPLLEDRHYGGREHEIRSEMPENPLATGFKRRAFLQVAAGGAALGAAAKANAQGAVVSHGATPAQAPAVSPPEKDVPNNILAQCPYCGVGCGTLIQTEKGRIVGMQPDPRHPTNKGLQCIKGLTSAEAIYVDRLTKPLIRKDMTDIIKGHESKTKGAFDADLFREASWEEAEELVSKQIAAIVKKHGGNSVGLYGSGQLPVEGQYLENLFMKGVLGSNTIEANARMCMTSAHVHDLGGDRLLQVTRQRHAADELRRHREIAHGDALGPQPPRRAPDRLLAHR
jgi:anaerobic selenocysteine-containing dehydrogenase